MRTSTDVMEHWHADLKHPGRLTRASLYELERCSQILWNEIREDSGVSEEIIATYRYIKTEISLRNL